MKQILTIISKQSCTLREFFENFASKSVHFFFSLEQVLDPLNRFICLTLRDTMHRLIQQRHSVNRFRNLFLRKVQRLGPSPLLKPRVTSLFQTLQLH
jgi:hypothetical protein